MDIYSKAPYPACALSNFAAHHFVFDGVKCASMEGLLQAFKTKNVEMQKEICKRIGSYAKKSGMGRNWRQKQILYWNGVEYPRQSEAYQELLTRAYDALFTSHTFRAALSAAGKDASFTHSRGEKKQNETILTTSEFIGQLNRLQRKLQEMESGKETRWKRRMIQNTPLKIWVLGNGIKLAEERFFWIF